MNLPGTIEGYEKLMEMDKYWTRQLKTKKGKKALADAESAVSGNFEKCQTLAAKVRTMLDE